MNVHVHAHIDVDVHRVRLGHHGRGLVLPSLGAVGSGDGREEGRVFEGRGDGENSHRATRE